MTPASPPALWAAVDPVAPVVLWLAVILAAGKFGGELAARLKQPTVLGEIGAGIVLGNLGLVGLPLFEPIKADPAVDMLGRVGVLLLLFSVGLKATVAEMRRVGGSALAVACLGVIAPFLLGWGVGAWLLPGASAYVHAFLGAALSATSVGITARVLEDLGQARTDEARVILGAAVIDDVLGLLVLAGVTGAISAADQGGTISYGALGFIVLKAVMFLAGAALAGLYLAPTLFRLGAKLRAPGILLSLGLGLCFLLSWVAAIVGLAPIVGAFAAGLMLEEGHYVEFVGRGERPLDELVEPLSSFLVPVFFVLMGIRTDLRAFVAPGALTLAAALTVAAVVGKQACGLGVLRKGVDRVAVGFGMIPRGEVGLIFASIGTTLTLGGKAVVEPKAYAAVVVMVIVTTLITPPALAWRMRTFPK